MLSSTFLGIAVRNDTRVAMPKINQEELSGILVAVPPLAEQRRIVGKVDQLLGRCDELASRQEAVRQASEKLLDAAIQSLLSEVGSHAKPRREQARMIQFLFASPRLRVTPFAIIEAARREPRPPALCDALESQLQAIESASTQLLSAAVSHLLTQDS